MRKWFASKSTMLTDPAAVACIWWCVVCPLVHSGMLIGPSFEDTGWRFLQEHLAYPADFNPCSPRGETVWNEKVNGHAAQLTVRSIIGRRFCISWRSGWRYVVDPFDFADGKNYSFTCPTWRCGLFIHDNSFMIIQTCQPRSLFVDFVLLQKEKL